MKVQLVYTYDINIFYEPEAFKEVNKMFQGMGGKGKIVMGGRLTQASVTITIGSDDNTAVTDEQLEKGRKIIQEQFTKALLDKGDEFKGVTIEVGKAQLSDRRTISEQTA